MRRVSSQEVKVLAETISSFYDKMANNNLKSVTILSNSIRYRDLSEKLYEAVLPKQLHSLLEEKLRYQLSELDWLTFNMDMLHHLTQETSS